MTKEELVAAIKDILNDYAAENAIELPASIGDGFALWGGSGILDSMGLIALITDVEDWINDRVETPVVLIPPEGMTKKASPFATIESLADYSVKLIQNEN